MLNLVRLRTWVRENQIMVVLLGIILGLVFPSTFHRINAIGTPLLICVFFFSSLRLSFAEVVRYIRDWRMLVIVSAYMLLVMPFAMYLPLRFFSPDWALALLIIGAVPTGMTIALIADYFHGNSSLALVVTAVTSLIAPITIPLVFTVAIGQTVQIPVLHMFWSLCLTIVVPFMLAMLVQRASPRLVKRHNMFFHEASIAAFGLLITGIVADSTGSTSMTLHWHDAFFLFIGLALMGLLTFASYEIVPWRKPSERITIALCMAYVNNTLALFIADKFFRVQHVLPKLVLLLVAINLLLPPIRIAAKRIADHHFYA